MTMPIKAMAISTAPHRARVHRPMRPGIVRSRTAADDIEPVRQVHLLVGLAAKIRAMRVVVESTTNQLHLRNFRIGG
jgi:hypothetical protein